MSFFDRLLPASLGGVPFGVLGGESHFGRRQALHQYPFRDTPWAEDLGRSARRIQLTGFLVEDDAISGGADVITQRDLMIIVAETAGPLTLIHPTLGLRSVSLDGPANFVERWDRGRYFEVSFSFVEAGQRVFPNVGVLTGSAVLTTALAAGLSIAADFAAADAVIQSSGAVLKMASGTALSFIGLATRAANDATNLFGMVSSLPGANGRFSGGASTGFLASAAPAPGAAPTVQSLIAAGSQARAGVAVSATALNAALVGGNSSTIAAASQALAAAVLAATVDPADGVRLLGRLATFVPAAFTPASIIGQNMAAMQTALGNLFRRSAVVSLAQASAAYQPASADDAVAVRTAVAMLLDSEIGVAGDNGEDATYGALRSLRQAVVADLNTRGAALPSLKTFAFQASLPSEVVALRLYRDAGRGAEIARETGAPHPAFQPLAMSVLAQ